MLFPTDTAGSRVPVAVQVAVPEPPSIGSGTHYHVPLQASLTIPRLPYIRAAPGSLPIRSLGPRIFSFVPYCSVTRRKATLPRAPWPVTQI